MSISLNCTFSKTCNPWKSLQHGTLTRYLDHCTSGCSVSLFREYSGNVISWHVLTDNMTDVCCSQHYHETCKITEFYRTLHIPWKWVSFLSLNANYGWGGKCATRSVCHYYTLSSSQDFGLSYKWRSCVLGESSLGMLKAPLPSNGCLLPLFIRNTHQKEARVGRFKSPPGRGTAA